MGEESILRRVTKNVLLCHLCVYVCVSVAYAHQCTYMCVNVDVRGGILVLSSNTFCLVPLEQYFLCLPLTGLATMEPQRSSSSTPFSFGVTRASKIHQLVTWVLRSEL